jgi:alpha-amylase/alpha-mannosidase (GH57 family)
MHQPYYKNLNTNTFEMPWVRLHGVKGYYDIPSIVDNFDNIKLTINIVPSLLEQLVDYGNKNGEDIYLKLSLKPAKQMTTEEKVFVIDNFFSVNHKLHLPKESRYLQLFKLRSDTKDPKILKQRVTLFSEQDITDLQMLFNLSWFGFTAKDKFPEINELILKKQGYTATEVEKVIKIQREIIASLIPLYSKLQKSGKIEISVSPYYHPILPLIYNSNFADRCQNTALPETFSYKEDAKKHIENAINYFEKVFSVKPKGMWPSEGSVSPEILELIKKSGIKWIATDEEILENSGFKGKHRYSYIYKPYQFKTANGFLTCVFRDKNLSDMIGFRCHKVNSTNAVQMFLNELNEIYNYNKNNNNDLIIPIILDGENPWEYYENSGKNFLEKLFSEIENNNNLKTETIENAVNSLKKLEILEQIHTGSWINANFKIWIGHEETNRAWAYLLKTRKFFDKSIKNIKDNSIKAKAFKEIMIAEGSDWFWWFGDDFQIKDKNKFDSLFRSHLANVYKFLKVPVPRYLHIPICKKTTDKTTIKLPTTPLNIEINGKKQNFFKWKGSGIYKNTSKGASMFEGESIIKSIEFAFNRTDFFVKVNSLTSLLHHTIVLHIQDSIEYIVEFKILNGIHHGFVKAIQSNKLTKTNIKYTYGYEEILEIAVPYTNFLFQKGESLRFALTVTTPKKQIYEVPGSQEIIDTKFQGKLFQINN